MKKTIYLQTTIFLLFSVFTSPAIAISWKTSIEAGYSLNSGNTNTENVYGSIVTKYSNEKNEFTISGNGKRGKSNNKKNEERYKANIVYNRLLTQSISIFVLSDIENDKFRKLDYRFNFGGGAKYTFVKDDIKNVSLSSALLYELKHNLGAEYKDELARISIRPKVSWKVFDNSRLSAVLFYQPKINYIRDYRIYSKISFDVPINNYLFFKTSYIHKYNSLPEKEIKYSDSSLVTSFVLSF